MSLSRLIVLTGLVCGNALLLPAVPAQAATFDEPQLLVARIVRELRGSKRKSSAHREYLVLYPDGTAFADMPEDGLDRHDAAALAEQSKKKTGTYSIDGETLTVTFPNWRGKQWVLTADRLSWRRDHRAVFTPARPISKERLQGTWYGAGKAALGGAHSGSPLPVGMGSERRLIFDDGGKFEQSNAGETRTGAWWVDGYTLIMVPHDAPLERHTVAVYPHAEAALLFDLRVYQTAAGQAGRR